MTRPSPQTAWAYGASHRRVGITRKVCNFTPSEAHATLRRTKRVEGEKNKVWQKIKTHHLIVAVFPLELCRFMGFFLVT